MSKFKKLVQDVASEVEMPKTKAIKEPSVKFNPKRATPEDCRVLDVAWAMKTIAKKAFDRDLTVNELDELGAYAFENAKSKALTTGDITELIPSGPSGQLIMDAWRTTTLSSLIPMEEVVDVSITRALQDKRLNVFRVSEATDATESEPEFTTFRYVVDKVMAYAVISTESMEDSMIDLAVQVIQDMQDGFAEAFENAIINGHNVVAEFDGTDWDATDIDGNAVTASNPITQFKGVRRLGFEKGKVDFTGSALTDVVFLEKVHAMQKLGGKYLSKSKVSKGEVAIFVDLQTYQRISRMDYFAKAGDRGSASTVGGGSPVDSFDGIPVYQLDFMPQVGATGMIETSLNNFGSMVMANVKFLKAYMKANSTTVKTDENIKNDTQGWAMRTRVGFGGLYDSTQTTFTVDTARKYIVLGYNIK